MMHLHVRAFMILAQIAYVEATTTTQGATDQGAVTLLARVEPGSYRPSGLCKAKFEGSNIIGYDMWTCLSTDQIQITEYGASDSTCSGTPLCSKMAQYIGSYTVECAESTTADGYIMTEGYTAAGCGGGVKCGQALVVTGFCTPIPAGLPISGGIYANSFMSNQDGLITYYGSTDCTGNPVDTSPKALDWCEAAEANTNICSDSGTHVQRRYFALPPPPETVDLAECSDDLDAGDAVALTMSRMIIAVLLARLVHVLV